MRIPLDYYQILGVPENNLSDLDRSYQDRLLQLPRQEYSDAAIESRKRLITLAYEVLSDPQRLADYAATYVSPAANTAKIDGDGNERATPLNFARRQELDISADHFLGGLLILFELGEYEEINSICMPYLGNNGRSSNSGSLHPQPFPSGNLLQSEYREPDRLPLSKVKYTHNGTQIIPLKPDIVLAMVSSFWELGEREWRNRCYEEATIHYEAAKKILVQEDLFPQIQGDLDRRLDRLRPYRIQSLVSLPLDRHEQRRQGIQFLEELLESACATEVKCQERFALNSESTISFIHETLPHLTAAEQRNLFSHLARDSHQMGSNALNVMQLACTYLHVHALIAQGFAYRNPQLIYTAQQILLYRLSQRIDVTIEQAICAILLGQTEEANQILATASESAALLVIRQQSQGLPNLLRGLCWYIESWLKNEAFPCFRDLIDSDPSLDAYFNDRDVQDFADRVPTNDAQIASWAAASPQLIEVPPSGDLSGSLPTTQPQSFQSERELLSPKASGRLPSSLNTVWQPPTDRLGTGNITPAIRVEVTPPAPPLVPEPILSEDLQQPNNPNNVIQLEQERQRRRSMPVTRTLDGQFETTYIPSHASSQLVPTAKSGMLTKSNSTGTIVRPRRPRRRPNIPRILLVGTGGVTCLWGAAWLAGSAIQGLTKLTTSQTPAITAPPSPQIAKNPDLAPAPPKAANKTIAVGLLTTDAAQQLVQKWLSAKSQSLGKNYQTSGLKEVLAEPALAKTIERANDAKASGIYWQYEHPNIEIAAISQANPVASTATIRARVTEDAKHYQGDRLNPDRSYSKQLLVQYDLVRQGDGWYIKNMDVVK